MFILSKPYVSDFLIETLIDKQYKALATEEAIAIIDDESLNWIPEQEAMNLVSNHAPLLFYTNSENGLDWITTNFKDSTFFKQISTFKDKVKFRELLKSLFPEFRFRQISLEELHSLDSKELSFPFVIKPAIGFFSIGVHIVNDAKEWNQVKTLITPDRMKSIFPESVLNTTQFIIEEYIEGEEYAIDYYHDQHGNVVILNILHHIFSSGSDTSDRVYSTSKSIITSKEAEIKSLLSKIGSELNLKNFPAHAEVRISNSGKIVPIEINPLRFGGWCTTADMMGMAIGFNPYIAFMEGLLPNWDKVFEGKEDKLFSIIVLDNNSGITPEDINAFDYERLKSDFENPLVLRKLDIKENPAFGFLFTETSVGNEEELNSILISDLRKYIKTKV